MSITRPLIVPALAAVLAGPAAAGTLPGPVPVEVVRVVDGDTIRVRAAVWIDLSLEVLVRIRGIDAPELNGRCDEEEAMAAEATLALAAAIGGEGLALLRIEDDKYFGRVVADVVTDGGTDVGEYLLAGGFARPYDGGTRLPWCPVAVGAAAP